MATQIGQIEQFQTGVGDWDEYTERLEQYFIANNLDTPEKKRAAFLTLIGPVTVKTVPPKTGCTQFHWLYDVQISTSTREMTLTNNNVWISGTYHILFG